MLHLYFLMLFWISSIAAVSKYPKLLIISFDGFRYDYFKLNLTTKLAEIKSAGTSADYMINVFPTHTFPNHHSIATGLYPEVHGVLGNVVYDPSTKTVKNYSELWSYNKKIWPFWTLNEKVGNGRHSGSMMWPGGEFTYDGSTATFYEPWKPDVPWNVRVDRVIEWFKHPTTPTNVVFLYFENPDAMSHAYGPNSQEVKEQITKVDKIAKYIVDEFRKSQLNEVNMVFLSDHGLAPIYQRNVINAKAVCGNDCNIYGTTPFRQVLPLNDEDMVYTKLKNFSKLNKSFEVYKKTEIPNRWNIKRCSLTLPIVLVAKPGYAFEDLYTSISWYKKHYPHIRDIQEFGVHGYDPSEPSMRPFFIAYGPQFKSNHVVKPFYNIDLYLLFSKMMALGQPPITPNGTLSNVQEILRDPAEFVNIL